MALLRWANERPYRSLLILFGICLFAFVIYFFIPRSNNFLIGSDGVGYYLYVRSLVIDHDLNFANEYEYFVPRTPFALTKMTLTSTGMVANKWAIGPGILWLPFFTLAHLLSILLQFLGASISTDGYSYQYQVAISFGSILYSFLGILMMFDITRKYYPNDSLSGIFFIWFSTNLIYYQLLEPSMAHMVSLFSVAFMLWLWMKFRPHSNIARAFMIGLAGGLVGIVRQTDALLLILPIIDLLFSKETLQNKVKYCTAIGIGFSIIFSIQMTVWWIIYGSPFMNGYTYSGLGFFWFSPKIISVLFSREHGLFLWHPSLLFAVIGLFLFWRKDRKLSALFLLGFLSQLYLIAAWEVWSQGASFGGRMFIATYPLLAMGLCAFIDWIKKARLQGPAWVVGSFLFVWNLLFMMQYRLHLIPTQGPVSLEQMTIGKYVMISTLIQKAWSMVLH